MHGTTRTNVGLAVALAVMTAAQGAFARTVYVNGVDVGDMRNQTFKDATVTIDGNGDIRIEAPRYKVELVDPKEKQLVSAAQEPAPNTGPNPALKTKYFLATKPLDGGRARYDIVIKVNGVEKRTIKAGEKEVIVEISAWFQPGANAVEIAARKRSDAPRLSTSAADTVRVVLGSGHEEGSIVKIDAVDADFRCDASQVTDIVKRYTVEAR